MHFKSILVIMTDAMSADQLMVQSSLLLNPLVSGDRSRITAAGGATSDQHQKLLDKLVAEGVGGAAYLGQHHHHQQQLAAYQYSLEAAAVAAQPPPPLPPPPSILQAPRVIGEGNGEFWTVV